MNIQDLIKLKNRVSLLSDAELTSLLIHLSTLRDCRSNARKQPSNQNRIDELEMIDQVATCIADLML